MGVDHRRVGSPSVRTRPVLIAIAGHRGGPPAASAARRNASPEGAPAARGCGPSRPRTRGQGPWRRRDCVQVARASLRRSEAIVPPPPGGRRGGLRVGSRGRVPAGRRRAGSKASWSVPLHGPGARGPLLGKMAREDDGLLDVDAPAVAVAGVHREARDRLRQGVVGLPALALRRLQLRDVPTLHALVVGVVLRRRAETPVRPHRSRSDG